MDTFELLFYLLVYLIGCAVSAYFLYRFWRLGSFSVLFALAWPLMLSIYLVNVGMTITAFGVKWAEKLVNALFFRESD